MKQKKTRTSRTAAGTVISSERSTRLVRDAGPMVAVSPAGRADDRTSAAGTAMADPWVEHTVHQVGGEVDEDNDDGEDEHDALDQRHVPVVDRLEQLVADPGQAEDLFHDHRRPDERGQVESNDREQPGKR